MARSTIKFLKQQGQFNTRIAGVVGCDRHTVARILTEPTDPPRRRQRASALEARRAAVLSWIAEAIPATRSWCARMSRSTRLPLRAMPRWASRARTFR
jgi:hypothetical protein